MAKRRYANDLYRIESTKSGDEIEFCKTFREAMATLKRYEKMDMKDGTFTPGFYTISRFTSVAKGSYYEPIYDSKKGLYGYRPTRIAKNTVKRK